MHVHQHSRTVVLAFLERLQLREGPATARREEYESCQPQPAAVFRLDADVSDMLHAQVELSNVHVEGRANQTAFWRSKP